MNFIAIKRRRLCMCKQIDSKCVALLPKIYIEFLNNPFSFQKKYIAN
jgi:hypothetical protein